MPTSKEWLGVFNSALYEMTNRYNWEQVNSTDMTVEEAIAVVETILFDFFNTEECTENGACLQPDGSRVLSLSVDGHIRQLANGAWVAPTDDYTVPPVPTRPEPTPDERKCLAAANAENVLKQTYEVAADAIAEGLDEAEIIAAMVAYLAAAIGLWLGLALAALAFALLALFRAFIEIAEFMTIDLWDEAFSDLLRCVLYGCADDSGDVVTFDFTCVNEEMAASVDLSGIDALNQLRLFGQVQFILNVIGVDGLNAAGATTEITSASCDDCEPEWSACFYFTENDGEWTVAPCYTNTVYSAAGWGRDANGIVGINRTFASTRITSFGIELDMPLSGNYHRMFWVQDGHVCTDPSTEVDIGANVEWGVFGLTGYTTSLEIVLQNGTPNTSYPLDYHVTKVVINGIGFNPFEEYPCEE